MPMSQPDAKTIMAMHRATGLPVLKARDLILSSPPELIRRIQESHRTRMRMREAGRPQQEDINLHDPIGDDPALGPIVHRVLEESTESLRPPESWERELCHAIWRDAERRLLQEHSIVWYSPKWMNPGAVFD